MPTIDPSGTPVPRTTTQMLQGLIDAGVAQFGVGFRNPSNPFRKIIEAFGGLPAFQMEQELIDLFVEFNPLTATGEQNVLGGVWPLFDYLAAAQATGIVHVSYNQIPTAPDPLFSPGDLEFIDGAGKRYTLTSAVSPPAALFDSNETGTASESIDTSTNTSIAQLIPLLRDDAPQGFRFKWNHTGADTVTVRLETDNNGEPSGTLAHANLEATGVAPGDDVFDDLLFTETGIIDTDGDYWLVITPESGDGTFDGGTGGTADQVLYYTGGAWVTSGVDNLNLELLSGGEFSVRAAEFGTSGNIDADSIATVSFNNTGSQTLWNTNVGNLGLFTNLEDFSGGRAKETPSELRMRARRAKAARETASVNGIFKALRDRTSGVTSADVIENDTMSWTSDDAVFDNSAATGVQSETIDTVTNTRIAQSFTTTEYASAVSVAVNLDTDGSSTFTIRIETDTAGAPSGTLASSKFTTTVTPGGTGRMVHTFDDGDFLAAGTYWVVIEATAGNLIVEGSGDGGVDSNVYYYDGAWNQSAVVDEIAVEVLGGLPPKSFRAYVQNGNDDDVAQTIYDTKAAGIYSDGEDSGSAIDAADNIVTVQFARPDSAPVTATVSLDVDSTFVGDEDTVKDLLIEYVGGQDTSGDDQDGDVGISDDLIYTEALSRFLHGDARTDGVIRVSTFTIGRKSASESTVDLTASRGELFEFVDTADIAVTITVL